MKKFLKTSFGGPSALILFTLLFIIYSCEQKSSPKKSKQLSVNITSEISTLDPIISYDNVSATVMYQIYEQLYEYHYLNRPYQIQPLLAEDMPTISNDGKRYRIKIKKNIYYHQHEHYEAIFGKGVKRSVTAYDFELAFKRLLFTPLKSSGTWIVEDLLVGVKEFQEKVGSSFDKMLETKIAGITVEDDHTLIIDLKETSPQFIYKLALSFISPTPVEFIKYYKNNLNFQTLGTGPFLIETLNPTTQVVLKRNPHYHENFYPSEGDRYANSTGLLKDAGEKIPFLDRVLININKDANSRFEKFINKELDILVIPQEIHKKIFNETGNLRENLKKAQIHLHTAPTLTFWWLSFNMRDPLLGKNLNLRKAIAHALDMEEYIKKFTNSTGQLANSILAPGVFGYSPNSRLPYSYNKELALDYLKKAGFPNGKGLPEIIYETRAESKLSHSQAQFFQEKLAEVGIRLKIVKNNFNEYLEKSRNSQFQFFQDGWTLDYPDVENIYPLLYSQNQPPGPNASFYNNPKFDAIYNKMSKLQDGPERLKLIREAEEIVNNDLPWIMQYYSRNFILYHDHVKNYRSSDVTFNYFKFIRVK